jgi:hypothetical protein
VEVSVSGDEQFWTGAILTIAAALLAVSAIGLVAQSQRLFHGPNVPWLNVPWLSVVLSAGLLVGVWIGCVGVKRIAPIPSEPNGTQDFLIRASKFQRYLIGLGYSLAVLSGINVVLLAGHVSQKEVPKPENQPSATAATSGGTVKGGGSGETTVDSTGNPSPGANVARETFGNTSQTYLHSILMALTGVLYFVAFKIHARAMRCMEIVNKTSMQRSSGLVTTNPEGESPSGGEGGVSPETQPEKDDHPEEFNPGKFWGGLCFRVGEAMLFSLVMILIFRGVGLANIEAKSASSLPVVCLFMGMFIEPFEKLIGTLSSRFVKVVE